MFLRRVLASERTGSLEKRMSAAIAAGAAGRDLHGFAAVAADDSGDHHAVSSDGARIPTGRLLARDVSRRRARRPCSASSTRPRSGAHSSRAWPCSCWWAPRSPPARSVPRRLHRRRRGRGIHAHTRYTPRAVHWRLRPAGACGPGALACLNCDGDGRAIRRRAPRWTPSRSRLSPNRQTPCRRLRACRRAPTSSASAVPLRRRHR